MSHSFKIFCVNEKLRHYESFNWDTDYDKLFQFIVNYLCFMHLTSDIMKNLPHQYLDLCQFIHKQGRIIEFSWTDPITGGWCYPCGYAIIYKKNQENKFRSIFEQGNHFELQQTRPTLIKNWPLFIVFYCFNKKRIPIFI
jgi:hypothetical protein